MPTDTSERNAEHQKDSPKGQHVSERCGTSRGFDWQIKNLCNVPQKFVILEAVSIAQRKPLLNTSINYPSQDLTLKHHLTVLMLLNSKIKS